MKLLGARLRQRRKQMHLRQRDLAKTHSASFLSKIENGTAEPSLHTLREWSQTLGTTSGELLGDNLVLEAAKQSVLLPKQCHRYLDQLPVCFITSFLRELSTSATSLSSPVPIPPSDPELKYLTAQVMLKRGMLGEAEAVLKKALTSNLSTLRRIQCFCLLCQIYDELAEVKAKKQVSKELHHALHELVESSLIDSLPEPDALTADDVSLLTLRTLLQGIATFGEEW